MVKENSFLMGPCVEEPSAPKKAPLRKGKSPKRCQWQKKRGGFEEVPRLAATIVAGNRLARRWAGYHGKVVTEGSAPAPLVTQMPPAAPFPSPAKEREERTPPKPMVLGSVSKILFAPLPKFLKLFQSFKN